MGISIEGLKLLGEVTKGLLNLGEELVPNKVKQRYLRDEMILEKNK